MSNSISVEDANLGIKSRRLTMSNSISVEDANLEIKNGKPKFSFLPLTNVLSSEFNLYQRIAKEYIDIGKLNTSLLEKAISPFHRDSEIYWTEAAYIMEQGAAKYSYEGWRARPTIIFCEALLRHEIALNMGYTKDEESTYSHKSHILCNILILDHLVEYELQND